MSPSSLPATLMRGGTRKAVFLHQRDLPAHARERDALIARLLGSSGPVRPPSVGSRNSSRISALPKGTPSSQNAPRSSTWPSRTGTSASMRAREPPCQMRTRATPSVQGCKPSSSANTPAAAIRSPSPPDQSISPVCAATAPNSASTSQSSRRDGLTITTRLVAGCEPPSPSS